MFFICYFEGTYLAGSQSSGICNLRIEILPNSRKYVPVKSDNWTHWAKFSINAKKKIVFSSRFAKKCSHELIQPTMPLTIIRSSENWFSNGTSIFCKAVRSVGADDRAVDAYLVFLHTIEVAHPFDRKMASKFCASCSVIQLASRCWTHAQRPFSSYYAMPGRSKGYEVFYSRLFRCSLKNRHVHFSSAHLSNLQTQVSFLANRGFRCWSVDVQKIKIIMMWLQRHAIVQGCLEIIFVSA